MEKTDFSQLINKAKNKSKTSVTQKVVPLDQNKKKENLNEVQFSFYIDKEVLKKLKMKALETESSIKSIINASIIYYLGKG